jgi:hypothetical protein
VFHDGCAVWFVSICYLLEEIMSDENTLTLGPREHDKLGISHCGVTREGFIAVAGDPRDIADGEEIVFERARIKAKRKGEEYTFSKI